VSAATAFVTTVLKLEVLHTSGRALLAFYYCQNPVKPTNVLQRPAILAANIAILGANIEFAGNISS